MHVSSCELLEIAYSLNHVAEECEEWDNKQLETHMYLNMRKQLTLLKVAKRISWKRQPWEKNIYNFAMILLSCVTLKESKTINRYPKKWYFDFFSQVMHIFLILAQFFLGGNSYYTFCEHCQRKQISNFTRGLVPYLSWKQKKERFKIIKTNVVLGFQWKPNVTWSSALGKSLISKCSAQKWCGITKQLINGKFRKNWGTF